MSISFKRGGCICYTVLSPSSSFVVDSLDLAGVVVLKGVVVGVTCLHFAGVVALKGVVVGVTGLH